MKKETITLFVTEKQKKHIIELEKNKNTQRSTALKVFLLTEYSQYLDKFNKLSEKQKLDIKRIINNFDILGFETVIYKINQITNQEY